MAVRARRAVRAVPDLPQRTLAPRAARRRRARRLPSHVRRRRARSEDAAVTGVGLTVYGCEPDEADLFNELSPRFGIVPTITTDAASEHGVISVPRNRCVSVGQDRKSTRLNSSHS